MGLALRIALGLMRSTPNNCLGVLSGIPPLAERFTYLNFSYLVAAFYRLGYPLRERLGVLGALNLGHCIKGYSDVLSLDIVPSESFTRHELPALVASKNPIGRWAYGEETCQCSGGDVFIRLNQTHPLDREPERN
jgi:hypothetical protein